MQELFPWMQVLHKKLKQLVLELKRLVAYSPRLMLSIRIGHYSELLYKLIESLGDSFCLKILYSLTVTN